MGTGKLIGVLGKAALGAAAPGLLENANKLVNDQLEQRKGYVKIPDITLLDAQEATSILDNYGLNHTLIKAEPNLDYANANPNTIVKMTPRGNAKVDPKTFIKVFYVDESIVDQSKQLLVNASEDALSENVNTTSGESYTDILSQGINNTKDTATNLFKKFTNR